MRTYRELVSAICLLFAGCVLSAQACAISLKYIYRGNTFNQFEGIPGIFSPTDRVTATFTIDCSVAHAEGNCRNLPYDDYFESGAIDISSVRFSAGPAVLAASDLNIEINSFLFATDSGARIESWDMDLYSAESSQNVDTDNVYGGTDSAAVPGSYANVTNLPGSWGSELPADAQDFDLAIQKTQDEYDLQDLLQPVEYTITVVNRGPGQARDVVVVEQLPAELEIPEGLYASTTTGYYDHKTGSWEVGTLDSTLPEVMKLPVVVKGVPETPCIVNTASVDVPGDFRPFNNESVSVLRLPASEGCVDLGVEAVQLSWPFDQQCPDTRFRIRYRFTLENSARDTARNVVLRVSQSDYRAPGITSESPDCDESVCTWAELGTAVTVEFATEYFSVREPITHGLTATVSSDGDDYSTANNEVTYRVNVPAGVVDCSDADAGPDWNFNIGSGGGCFIATAVYGADSHPHVQTLRVFRDEVLNHTNWGRSFVAFYYRNSPEIARYISEHDAARTMTRALLTPLVLIIGYPLKSALLVVALLAAVWVSIKLARAGRGSS